MVLSVNDLTPKLRVLDLFSGIGGFSLGLEATGGFETVAFCEMNEYADAVLEKHWPHVDSYEDVRDITKERLEEDGIGQIDVICGGFPCQDISEAGKGRGLLGKRSGLWSEYHRIIGEIRPKWVIIENVRALRGNGLVTVLQNLGAIGYDAEWHIIPASLVGAPHLRERVWVVAWDTQNSHSLQEREIFSGSKAYTNTRRISGELTRAWDEDEPKMDRVDDGLPRRVDRLRCLGNAVVPQIPELIGMAILEAHHVK